VKSTARLFGTDTARWLRRFIWATVGLMALAVVLAFPRMDAAAAIAMAGPFAMGAHMRRQVRRLDIDDTEGCLRLFRSNRNTGLIVVAAFAVAVLAVGTGVTGP